MHYVRKIQVCEVLLAPWEAGNIKVVIKTTGSALKVAPMGLQRCAMGGLRVAPWAH
jgi:hypothetical protein